jgi:hypothetical protein
MTSAAANPLSICPNEHDWLPRAQMLWRGREGATREQHFQCGFFSDESFHKRDRTFPAYDRVAACQSFCSQN